MNRSKILLILALSILALASMALPSSLTSYVRVVFGTQLSSGSEIGNPQDFSSLDVRIPFDPGTDDGEADSVFKTRLFLGPGASQTFDLSNGNLLNPIGEAVSFGHVKVLFFHNVSTQTWFIVGNASQAFEGWISGSGTVEIATEGITLQVNPGSGWEVIDGVSDSIRFQNPGLSSGSCDVVFSGTSI